MARDSLYDVITAAVSELSETGFVSAERVAYWQRKIAEAAERSMASNAQMEQTLREAMAAIYKRTVENGGALKYHRGVSRFTLEQIKPALRRELDRRIMASADLIKLNREQAVAKTLQRFSGWATSIPAGGTDTVNRAEEKTRISKALKQLPYEVRRLHIDQGHKLVASINETIARDAQAIAMQWHSRWRQPGYDYRPDHKERDEKIYLLRNSWAREAGLVKPGPAGCYEDITAVAEEPFCRCSAVWIYNLRDLPSDMLTAKGATELERARKVVAAA